MASVDQQQLEVAFLEEIPDRLPVLAGRFHHHLGHPLGSQPAGQRLQARGERVIGTHLAAPPALAVGRPHTGHHLEFADVQAGAPFDQQVHGSHLQSADGWCPAGPTESTTLKGVLEANNSWCREGPRISLRLGLSRTKENRAWPGTTHSHPSWRPPAMGV